MKVLLINGSPNANGNTAAALKEVAAALNAEGVETDTVCIGTKPVQGCIGCRKCKTTGVCVFKDELYLTLRQKASGADGIIIGSPVYYAGPAGSLCAVLDRLFYSSQPLLQYKPAASVAVARRAGSVAAFDRLNKYFGISNMPVVSSTYWNIVFGCNPGEAQEDAEGMLTMRTLGRNMAWLLRKLHAGDGVETPAPEPRQATNFIR